MSDDLMSPRVEAGTVEYEWMTWPEAAEHAGRGTPVVISVGATEQHGPHLPLATDWAVPAALLRLAARKQPMIIGPHLRLGYRSRPGSGGGQHFPGTLSLRATTFMAVLEDVLDELVRTGFRQIMIYNWHFENAGFVYEPAFLVSQRSPDTRIVVVEDPMPRFSEADLAMLFPDGFPGLELEHAAVIETSLFHHFRPAAIRSGEIRDDAPLRHPPYDVLPIDPAMSTPSGVLAEATKGSAAKGALLADRISDHIAAIVNREFGDLPAPATELEEMVPDAR
ncbi:MAG TPA: creatininase [Amycolatopsis sp.]|nr:creatininase [Amycolatopsis sp.]